MSAQKAWDPNTFLMNMKTLKLILVLKHLFIMEELIMQMYAKKDI